MRYIRLQYPGERCHMLSRHLGLGKQEKSWSERGGRGCVVICQSVEGVFPFPYPISLRHLLFFRRTKPRWCQRIFSRTRQYSSVGIGCTGIAEVMAPNRQSRTKLNFLGFIFATAKVAYITGLVPLFSAVLICDFFILSAGKWVEKIMKLNPTREYKTPGTYIALWWLIREMYFRKLFALIMIVK